MSFESLTDEKIAELIELPKRVTNPGAREMDDGAYLRRDYEVVSAAGDKQIFRLFTRQNKKVSNDFSCGLRWLAPGTDGLMLLRYNGPSHSHTNKVEKEDLDHVCHIHRATARYIRANRKAEGFAEETRRYRTLRGALHELVKECRIEGLAEADQSDLFQ
jgi:hypothetical protein